MQQLDVGWRVDAVRDAAYAALAQVGAGNLLSFQRSARWSGVTLCVAEPDQVPHATVACVVLGPCMCAFTNRAFSVTTA